MTATNRAAWDAMAEARAAAERDWPDAIYLPAGEAMEAIVPYLPPSGLAGMAQMAAGQGGGERQAATLAIVESIITLGVWRMTQGIYRFDPALYEALVDTPLTGEIPGDVLMRLPQWCVYVETPGLVASNIHGDGAAIHGAWARVDLHMTEGGARERRLTIVPDVDRPALTHQHIPLVGTVEQAVRTGLRGWEGAPYVLADITAYLSRIVSLLLYLCTDDPDLTRHGQADAPANPAPKQTRRQGLRVFPASGPLTWDVGVRIGSALREAYRREQAGGDGAPSGRSVRPHVRRAHWHTFLSGPRLRADGSSIPADQRRRDLRWVPPIAVNVDDLDDLPATIRPVKL